MAHDPNNTYCTVEDVTKRLTRYGIIQAVSVDSSDNDIDDEEIEYVHDAISYANNLIDAAVFRFKVDTNTRPQIEWLRDRATDIAAFRIATLGGRDAPVVLRDDYIRAREEITAVRTGAIDVPGLSQSEQTNKSRRHQGSPFAINIT